MSETAMGRRALLGVLAALAGACVVRARGGVTPHDRRVMRRMRRRARRRVRRRVAWRAMASQRVVVVPVDIDGDDVIVLEDGRVATVVEARPAQGVLVVEVDGTLQEIPAAFEGEVGANPSDPEP